jgi:hypothetical protein
MKLTGRQRAFLGDFLDLYREAQDALHYTTVAERLGVGRITCPGRKCTFVRDLS